MQNDIVQGFVNPDDLLVDCLQGSFDLFFRMVYFSLIRYHNNSRIMRFDQAGSKGNDISVADALGTP
jgi:hypothetical protein